LIDTTFKTLHDFALNGYTALEELIRASAYKSIEQAVASLTLFSHPETVRQTGCKAVFPTIRNAARRGQRGKSMAACSPAMTTKVRQMLFSGATESRRC
jgi:hypothetical protein